jgi:predicted nucleic acid-binding protein
MTRQRIVLDTDVASRILRHQLDLETSIRIKDAQWMVTFATVGELWKWAETKRWGPGRREELGSWLRDLAVLDSDADVAREWGRACGLAALRGRPRPDNDAWIAACCRVHEVPLATFNVKDFVYHVEHDGLVLVG